ncbi:MAG TPA: hypothetical protein VFD58_35650 [Blastocatellia bacterium]|nr:hypothetical protein [Blastocatellia bacterium]
MKKAATLLIVSMLFLPTSAFQQEPPRKRPSLSNDDIEAAKQEPARKSSSPSPEETKATKDSAAASDWKEFVSKEGAFAVLMPGGPIREDLPTGYGSKDDFHRFQVTREGLVCIAGYADGFNISSSSDPALRKFVFDKMQEALVKGSNSRVRNEKEISWQNYPGRELEVVSLQEDVVSRIRVYLAGHRMYVTMMAVPASEAGAETVTRFRDSFRITNE